MVILMSDVEIVQILNKILLHGIKTHGTDNKVICTSNSTCTILYNPSIELVWDPNGYLTEVRISGIDQNGNNRSFKKTLTWSAQGLLTSVSAWEEV